MQKVPFYLFLLANASVSFPHIYQEIPLLPQTLQKPHQELDNPKKRINEEDKTRKINFMSILRCILNIKEHIKVHKILDASNEEFI